MTLKSRFEARPDLIEALRAQKIIQGDVAIAARLADFGELVSFSAGQNIIEQGAHDRDLYLLLAGKASVIANGFRMYPREKNMTVGEMSAVNAEIARAATIQADEETVAWKITHAQLDAVGEEFPRIWRLLAVDLAGRLHQRNKFINRQNPRPRIFIICSAEALPIAEAIKVGLDHEDATVQIWSEDFIFRPGSYPLEDLEREVNEADFGIAIAQPDDLVRSRDRKSMTPRDNVIFELGFFMSRLGRARTLLLVPRGEDVKLPSDFKGLNPLEYKTESASESLASALGATIIRVKAVIREKGVRSSLVEAK